MKTDTRILALTKVIAAKDGEIAKLKDKVTQQRRRYRQALKTRAS